jgi:tetratricopeptide (TPR) repeat protein
MKKTLNVRYLVGLVLVLAAAATAVYFAHRRQAGKLAEAYLHQADAAEKDGQAGKAADYLRRYLAMQPADTDARARLGLILAKQAKTANQMVEAYLVLEQVLREDGNRTDIRRKTIKLAMDPRLGLYPEARGHLEALGVGTDSKDGELEDLYGQCLEATGEYGMIGDDTKGAYGAYRRATRSNSTLVDAHARLAYLLLKRLNDQKKADELIENLTRDGSNAANYKAYLVAAAYWKERSLTGLVSEADELKKRHKAAVENARRLAANEPEVLLAVADLAHTEADALAMTGKREDAEQARKVLEDAAVVLRQGIANAPNVAPDPQASDDQAEQADRRRAAVAWMYRMLTATEVRAGHLPEAEAAARKGAEAFPDDPEMAVTLADVLIRRGDLDGAGKQLDQLDKAGYSAAVLGYHRARVQAAREQWREASQTLERVVAADPTKLPDSIRGQANKLLGDCYERLGQPDRQYEANRRAVPANPLDPLWGAASAGMASALVAMGRTDEALPVYERVARYYPATWVTVGRLRLAKVLRDGGPKPDFSGVEDALRYARAGGAALVEADLLQADLLVARGETDKARELLRASRDTNEKAIEPWVGLALIESRGKDPGKAADLLRQAEAKFGDRVEIRLARARLTSAAPTPQAAEQIKQLAAGAERFSAPDRRRLLRTLAEMAQALGLKDVADKLWGEVVDAFPNDLGVQLALFDRAMRGDDENAMGKAEREILRLDGPQGQYALATRVMTLLWKARRGDKSGLAEATELLAGLERDRGGWSRVPLWQAMALDYQGKLDQAIPKYRQAVDMGERDPEVIRRLAEYYVGRNQFDDAEQVFKKLPEGAAADSRFQTVAAELAIKSHDEARLKTALAAAERDAQKDPKDYRKQLWIGRLRWQAGQRKEAEAPLNRAVELAGDRPEPWVALVQYLVAEGRKADAATKVEEAKARIKGDAAGLTAAQCYELLGSRKQAKEVYDRLLVDRKDDAAVLRAAASFFQRTGDLKTAEEALKRLDAAPTRTPEDAAFVRRSLPVVIAAQGGIENARKALELLGPLAEGAAAGSAEDQRARAVTLALQPDLKSKREAVRLLEESGGRRPLDPAERFLLAQLYAVTGDWPMARARLAALLQDPAARDNPLFVSYYAMGLIREGDKDEAETWVKKLEDLRPDSLQAAELRARLLVVQGDRAKARDVLTRLADRKDAPALGVAVLLEQLGIGDAAEPFYKRFVEETKPKQPEAVLILATYYARQNRLKEALDICREAWTTCKPEVVAEACVTALYSVQNPDKGQVKQAIDWVEEARGKKDSAVLSRARGNLQNLLADYKATIAGYQEAIRKNPRDAIALNNLAFLLSLTDGKHDEALKLLERAKAVVGPAPTILDTEAIVSMAKGEPQKAVELMTEVVAQAPSGVGYFHLAQAYLKAGKRIDALSAWKQAKSRNFKISDLHPLERNGYQEVAAALGGGD